MKFTIVTPSLNQGAFLEDTLRSVRTAAANLGEAGSVEHLVIDGGSTDRTLEILRAQDFALWISEPDRGQSDAINKGFQRAGGDVLSWLCSDDLLEPVALREVAAAFAAAPDTDVVYGDYWFLEGNSGWKRPKQAGAFSVDRLWHGNFLSQPAVFMRRAVFERFGLVDVSLRYCMDHEYWLRIAKDTRWHYIAERLAVMRLHSDAKSSAQLAPAWWETARMTKRYGCGGRFLMRALWMQFLGQYAYRARRRWYRWLGHRRR